MTTRTRLLLALAALAAGAAALVVLAPGARAQAAAPPRYLRILVEDHSGLTTADQPLPTLHLASSATGWDPAGVRDFETIQYRPAGADADVRAWVFMLDRDTASRPGFQFKFTRGSWATVEVAADGADISNRTFAPDQIGRDPASPLILRLEGFADQRGSRWPEAPAPGKSTLTGRLDVFTIATDHLPRRPTIRVWLPPGYADPAHADRRYPVMYMHDGQNLFDAATSFAGEWGADETATTLIDKGAIPPLIIVGIDNAGPDRAAEYNPPYTRWQDRDNYADRYLAFIADDLMPLVNERYRTRTGPEHTGLGGSSFGAAVTLYAMMERPGLFSRALVESPAVQASGGAILQRLRDFEGPWPERVFVGVGTHETDDPERNALYTRSARQIADILAAAGLAEGDVHLVVESDAIHHESAWARRLPGALRFLWAQQRPAVTAPPRDR